MEKRYFFSFKKCFPRGSLGAKVKIGSKTDRFLPFSEWILAFFCLKTEVGGAQDLFLKRSYQCTIGIGLIIIQCSLTLPTPKCRKKRFSEIALFHRFFRFWISWIRFSRMKFSPLSRPTHSASNDVA